MSLTLDCPGPLPETIETDPTRLRQILINLVGNAVKLTRQGGVRVNVRYREGTETGTSPPRRPAITFEVIDTGIGMAGAQMEQLFQPFHQADASTTRTFGGTGLGLAVSQRLAGMLGGDVTAESTLDRGSVFCLTVATGPLDGVKMVVHPAEAVIEAQTSAENRPQRPLDCRILLAEDGPDNQRLISFILRKVGAEVTIAANGQEAVDLALAGEFARRSGDPPVPFDLIPMDMQMPVMDGYQATATLRAKGYAGPRRRSGGRAALGGGMTPGGVSRTTT